MQDEKKSDKEGFVIASNEVIRLRWRKEYESALSLFKKDISSKYSRKTIANNYFLVSAICDCLKETGKIAEAINFIVLYLKMDINSVSLPKRFLINLSWTFYFALNDDVVCKRFLKGAHLELISDLLKFLHYEKDKELFNLLFFQYTKFHLAHNNPDWLLLLSLTETYAKNEFSHDVQTFTKDIAGQSKVVEMASPLENWYMLKIKALYSLNRYDECVKWCKGAFDSQISGFHYGNQIWISRYMARCYVQSGNISEAINVFERIISKKNEWFLQKELAGLYLRDRKFELALNMASIACVSKGYTQFKVSLFALLANIFDAIGDSMNAVEWRKLEILVRREQGWPISAQHMSIDIGEIENKAATCVFQQLSKRLPGLNEKDEQFTKVLHGTGRITRILHPGEKGDGFITTDDGMSVYFRFGQSKISVEQIDVGVEVSFKAVQNSHKGKEIWKALKVYLK
jgi:tetratricopeptide (TPR) repeat protein